MRTPVVIVVHVGLKDAAQMPLVEHDDLIETLTPDTANDSFRIWVVPRAVRRNLDRFHPQMLDALLECGAVDRVPIP
jgi:hypothetical protein